MNVATKEKYNMKGIGGTECKLDKKPTLTHKPFNNREQRFLFPATLLSFDV
jgi:hypothetical protein